MPAKPLKWRKPQDTGQDYGQEGARLIADGIGGIYAIEADGLLWWAHDPFTFVECASIPEAKAVAEADWQKRYAALEAPAGRAALTQEDDHAGK